MFGPVEAGLDLLGFVATASEALLSVAVVLDDAVRLADGLEELPDPDTAEEDWVGLMEIEARFFCAAASLSR